MKNDFKIGVVCASSRFSRERADRIEAWMAEHHPDRDVSVVFHPACFLKHGHFAGDDRARTEAFVAFANDPRIDAIWFARGGYGSCRIAEAVIPRLDATARKKRYMGYSDAGSLLAGMYKAGFQHLAHGPMASDAVRHDETARGALSWLTTGRTDWIEPSLAADPRPAVAFNLTILNELTGTALEPDLSDHVLMLEEVSEAAYRIDRMMFHLTGQASYPACGWNSPGTCFGCHAKRSRFWSDTGRNRSLLVPEGGHPFPGNRRYRARRRQQGRAVRPPVTKIRSRRKGHSLALIRSVAMAALSTERRSFSQMRVREALGLR